MKLDRLRRRFRLAKIWLSLLVGLSTLFGSMMASEKLSITGGFLGVGVYLLAMGGATLNSWQEREPDGHMQRTRRRPMVKREFSDRQALVQASLLIAIGCIILVCSASFFSAFFALAGLVIYNLVYTPLKKKSLFAIFPGAVCGAIPPCVGWIGVGGGVNDYRFWLLFGLFFLWQIPHFWLVMMMYPEDYTQGPNPSLLDKFPQKAVKFFFIPWIGSLLVTMLLFMFQPNPGVISFSWLIVFNCTVLGGLFVFQLGIQKQPAYRLLFIALNMALVVHMGVVSLAILTG